MNSQIIDINHIAIIMDGNARWASLNGFTKAEGHKMGAEAIKNLIPNVMQLGIPYLTLYAFSSENWKRDHVEISVLIKLLSYYLKKEIKLLTKNGIKLKIIGKFDRLSKAVQKRINEAIELTKDNNKMTLCIAFGYGSRIEIVDACQKAMNSGKNNITEDDFKNYLYDPDMPDVDLLIRTSGVYRISNFLLWQLAYAELYFCEKYWPDFTKDDLIEALDDYAKRTRTFGAR